MVYWEIDSGFWNGNIFKSADPKTGQSAQRCQISAALKSTLSPTTFMWVTERTFGQAHTQTSIWCVMLAVYHRGNVTWEFNLITIDPHYNYNWLAVWPVSPWLQTLLSPSFLVRSHLYKVWFKWQSERYLSHSDAIIPRMRHAVRYSHPRNSNKAEKASRRILCRLNIWKHWNVMIKLFIPELLRSAYRKLQSAPASRWPAAVPPEEYKTPACSSCCTSHQK